MRRESDYFLRIIHQFTAVIMEVSRLNRHRNGAADDLIVQTTTELIDLTPHALAQMRDEDVLGVLQLQARNEWPARAVLLATLLWEAGRATDNNSLAVAQFQQALSLTLAVCIEQWELPDFAPTVADLLDLLADYLLPGTIQRRLLLYYETVGAFGQAEDVLFDWQETAVFQPQDDSPDPTQVGIAFYQRLLQKSDEDLIAGGLPRAEVETGLDELLTHQS